MQREREWIIVFGRLVWFFGIFSSCLYNFMLSKLWNANVVASTSLPFGFLQCYSDSLTMCLIFWFLITSGLAPAWFAVWSMSSPSQLSLPQTLKSIDGVQCEINNMLYLHCMEPWTELCCPIAFLHFSFYIMYYCKQGKEVRRATWRRTITGDTTHPLYLSEHIQLNQF
jgi:hypothetical protein